MKLFDSFKLIPGPLTPHLLECDDKLFLLSFSLLNKSQMESFTKLILVDFDFKTFGIESFYVSSKSLILISKNKFVVFKYEDKSLFKAKFVTRMKIVHQSMFTAINISSSPMYEYRLSYIKEKKLYNYYDFNLIECDLKFEKEYLSENCFVVDGKFVDYSPLRIHSFMNFVSLTLRGELIEVINLNDQDHRTDKYIIKKSCSLKNVDSHLIPDDLKIRFKKWFDNLIPNEYLSPLIRIRVNGKIMIDSPSFKEPIPDSEIIYYSKCICYKIDESIYFSFDPYLFILEERNPDTNFIFSDKPFPLKLEHDEQAPSFYVTSDMIVRTNLTDYRKISFDTIDIFVKGRTIKTFLFPLGREKIINLEHDFDEIECILSVVSLIIFTRSGNSLFISCNDDYSINYDLSSSDELFVSWIDAFREGNKERFDKNITYYDIFEGMTPKEHLLTFNAQRGSSIPILFTNDDSNASGFGVYRHVRSIIDDFIKKEYLIDSGIWPTINKKIIDDGMLIHVFIYMALSVKYWHPNNFRFPIQFLLRIGKLCDMYTIDVESQLLYFVRHEDSKKYEEILSNSVELLGYDNLMDLLKDTLHFDKDIENYLDRYEKTFEKIMDVIDFRMPNLQTLDFLLSGEITTEKSRESFIVNLKFTGFLDGDKEKIINVLRKLNDEQFGNFLFNISSSRKILNLDYEIKLTREFNSIRFVSCQIICIISDTILELEEDNIVEFLSDLIEKLAD